MSSDARSCGSPRFSCLIALVLVLAAPAAFAADGVGLAGRTDDKTVTFFCFGVIAFFPSWSRCSR